MKFTQIARTETQILQEKALAALQAVAAEYGITVEPRPGRYTGTSATLTFEFATVGEDGGAHTKTAEAYRLLAQLYGLDPSQLGQIFTLRGAAYRVIGLNTKAGKFPVMGERVIDRKGFKFGADTVASAFAQKKTLGL